MLGSVIFGSKWVCVVACMIFVGTGDVREEDTTRMILTPTMTGIPGSLPGRRHRLGRRDDEMWSCPGRDNSCSRRPARTWARWLSCVAMPEVRSPTIEPATAKSADRYATSMDVTMESRVYCVHESGAIKRAQRRKMIAAPGGTAQTFTVKCGDGVVECGSVSARSRLNGRRDPIPVRRQRAARL